MCRLRLDANVSPQVRHMPNNRIAPCKCGFLERQANHPDSPIRFDSELNEYHFIHRTSISGESKMMIYHCPFCGGRAPKSRRSELFHRLTHAEQHRLSELTKDMRTIQDVTVGLGEPDIRQPIGMVSPHQSEMASRRQRRVIP